MTRDEAKAECLRYLAHLDREQAKSVALQRLATERRRGTCDEREMRRRLAEIQGPGIRVYDGAQLADAIRVLIDEAH